MDQVMEFVVANVPPAPKGKKAPKAPKETALEIFTPSLPAPEPAPWESLFGKVGEAAVRVRLRAIDGDKAGNRLKTQLSKMAVCGAQALQMGATLSQVEDGFRLEVAKADAVVNKATSSLGLTEEMVWGS